MKLSVWALKRLFCQKTGTGSHISDLHQSVVLHGETDHRIFDPVCSLFTGASLSPFCFLLDTNQIHCGCVEGLGFFYGRISVLRKLLYRNHSLYHDYAEDYQLYSPSYNVIIGLILLQITVVILGRMLGV